MYRLIKQEGNARRGEFTTVHGTVQTPGFMNVATTAAIKGGLSAFDLKDIMRIYATFSNFITGFNKVAFEYFDS